MKSISFQYRKTTLVFAALVVILYLASQTPFGQALMIQHPRTTGAVIFIGFLLALFHVSIVTTGEKPEQETVKEIQLPEPEHHEKEKKKQEKK